MSEERVQLKCNCGLPVGRRTSWTERNPGRRFMCCKFYEPESEWRGCNFFKWIDEDMTEWQRYVMNKLVLEKKLLETQLNAAQNEVNELQGQRSLLLTENENLKVKYKAVNAELKMTMKKKMTNNKKRGGNPYVYCKVAVVMLIMSLVVMYYHAVLGLGRCRVCV